MKPDKLSFPLFVFVFILGLDHVQNTAGLPLTEELTNRDFFRYVIHA